jgi:hypothetical protein
MYVKTWWNQLSAPILIQGFLTVPSVTRGTIVWEISKWQTNKTNKPTSLAKLLFLSLTLLVLFIWFSFWTDQAFDSLIYCSLQIDQLFFLWLILALRQQFILEIFVISASISKTYYCNYWFLPNVPIHKVETEKPAIDYWCWYLSHKWTAPYRSTQDTRLHMKHMKQCWQCGMQTKHFHSSKNFPWHNFMN